MDPDRVVRDFCAAWTRKDLDAIMAAFTDDAVYHNIPMQPCRGKPAIRTFIAGFLGGMSGIEFDVRYRSGRRASVIRSKGSPVPIRESARAKPRGIAGKDPSGAEPVLGLRSETD